MSGIEIDDLPVTNDPSGEHAVPAMKDGSAVQLTVQQIIDLVQTALQISALTGLPLSTDNTDLPITFTDGSGLGLIDGELRFFIGGDVNASVRIDRGDLRIRSNDGAAAMRLRRMELNSSGNHLGSILASGRIATIDGSDERLFGRLRFVADDVDEASMQGALQVLLTDGYAATENERVVIEFLANLIDLKVVATYQAGVTPTGGLDIPHINKVGEMIGEGVGTPNPIPVAFPGPVADGTYTLYRNITDPFIVKKVNVESGEGSGFVAIQKNGAAVTGWGALSAGPALVSASAPNDGTENYAEGNSMALVISGATGLANLNVEIESALG